MELWDISREPVSKLNQGIDSLVEEGDVGVEPTQVQVARETSPAHAEARTAGWAAKEPV